jgi:tetratricopeptide (TPR) repeat protein
MNRGGRLAASALAALVAGSSVPLAQRSSVLAGITEARALRAIYDAILNADSFEADRLLAQTCPPAPSDACLVLDAVAVLWRIQRDPDGRALDETFEKKVDAAIAATEAWTVREPKRAEAWFYKGGAYGTRVQWRVLRREPLSAARDGNEARDSLERAVTLNPRLFDAHFGIGLYKYYADVAPRLARMVRWLLFLPGGDRVEGLREMLEARTRGALLPGEADYQLNFIYLWYEESAPKALDLMKGLRARYPRNPLFVSRIGFIEDVYFHDHAASLATYQTLLDLARLGQVNDAESAEVVARLGLASELDHLYETDETIVELRRVMAGRSPTPFGAQARASLALGRAQERLGARPNAVVSYRSALDFARREGLTELADEAQEAIRSPSQPGPPAEAYRMALQAWRHVQRGELDQATPLLARARELDPGDPVIEFRFAKLMAARGEPSAALAAFERVIGATPAAPATFHADACLESGRILESQNRLTAAAERYRSAANLAGASSHTREAARRSLARIQPAAVTNPAR